MKTLERFIEVDGEKYYPVIGLEIHAELNTKTKMWCGCKNDPHEEEANKHVCPICLAHPGTLPVPNREAIKNVMKMGFAVGGNVANFTEFDRKNYFYPDIPKGYQISQYKYPIVSGGSLNGVELTRIHLEEDTATSTHDKSDNTLVNFNRAGVPLMELVTEPVIYDAETAIAFANEMQLMLKYLNISDADIEKGHMRMEANVSITKDPNNYGTKVEVKNIGSFKSLAGAINFEFKRQIEAIKNNEPIAQETRGFDEASGTTKSQRSKENAQDYRYFPDPDISKMYLQDNKDFMYEEIKNSLPELPKQRRSRYSDLGLKTDVAELFVTQTVYGDYFDSLINGNSKELLALASNYISSDLAGALKDKDNKEEFLPKIEFFKELITLTQEGKLSSRATKDILSMMLKNKESNSETSPNQIATEKDLFQISDETILLPIIQSILEKETNQKSIADYKAGKEASLMALVGQAIKETSGKANPTVTRELFIKNLQ